jgi:hypothetical protein
MHRVSSKCIFSEHVATLEDSFARLLACPRYRRDSLPPHMPIGRVYLFSESSRPFYVGRSQARLRERIRDHGRPTNASKNASLAERLVLDLLGTVDVDTWTALADAGKPIFSAEEYSDHMLRARRRVAEMDIQFVEERDSVRRALLEIYVAVTLETPYNAF